jgi:CHRD domain-containing protein
MGAMIPEEPQGVGGISRRRMLRRIGAGVAVAWTAPILTSVRVPAYAQTSAGCHLRASMDALQETPPNNSPGTGTAVFTRTAPNQLSYTYDYQNLVAGVNGCHIHEAPLATPGPIVIPLSINAGTTSGSVSDTATADPALLDRICANPAGFYINLHTDAFPGGEIRGQLQPF